ncbi:MAG: tRNA pseudouridine(38-40) synthase TruA [Candidatus Hydrothermarchaeales archaeon]
MRYAVKLFYNGRAYHGSQVQPDVRTVEGRFLKALIKLNIQFKDFQSAGRTDKGVSAQSNVFAITTDSNLLKPRIINAQLPKDIRVLAVKRVDDNFNPRKEAEERVYKYFLFDQNYDFKTLKKAIKLFEGEHSFHNFAILEGKNPIRKIKRCELTKSGEVIILTFFGESFLWQMIRRMVTALKMVGKGEFGIGELEEYFDVKIDKKIPPSEAENLILWDVKYGFEFEDEEYSKETLISMISLKDKELKKELAMGEEILKNMMLK